MVIAYSYTDKVAVITGASRGIGFNVPKALVERGVNVVIGDLLDEQGHAVVKDFNNRAGKIVILNEGIAENYAQGIFTPLDDREDMFIQDVNLGGVIKGSKVALLHMANTIAAYGASKHGVLGWTRGLANMKAVANIRVNAGNGCCSRNHHPRRNRNKYTLTVCPYWIQTEIIGKPENGASRKFIEMVPKTTMNNVVQAFLRCIEDQRLVGDAVHALPNGHYVEPQYLPQESCFTQEILEMAPELEEAQNAVDKQRLAAAIKAAKL
ncbi:hypothetical protein BDA99DRAFT_531120 [Phascolomyces articulosus]|uniref:Uncharacterized protein n=1 Tax=Phascolomyces articulosus TaxID=60185 RepID=A0AAD5KR78_9FUNG|nr:hypothetical protein BDA99DRAFT_531120 [Phascolomyces articulosus]